MSSSISDFQELQILKQDMRVIVDAQKTLNGLVNTLLEQQEQFQAEIDAKEGTILALTASVVRLFAESERHAAERDDLLKVIQRHGMRVNA